MLGYLSLDITCSSKLTVFLELRSRKIDIRAYFRTKWRLLFLYILHICNTFDITASNLLKMALVIDGSDASNSCCQFD